MAKPTPQTCRHCRAPLGARRAAPDEELPDGSSPGPGLSGPATYRDADAFCCAGCRAAHALISEAGLGRYYELSAGAGTPGDATPHPMAWLDAMLEKARAISPDPRRVALTVDLQGMHCAGCVWLLQALFKKKPGAIHLDINPGLGRLTATFDPERFDLQGYLSALAQLGYRSGPPLRDPRAASDGLGLRLGITFAIAMNAMAISAAGYFGLEENDPDGLSTIFGWVNLALATAAFAVGAPVFIRGALRALRSRAFHLDLPIALGLVLAFSGSLALFFSGEPQRAYFDTLDIFIALMLLGRWAQRRFLEKNRRLLLEDDGFDSARVKLLDANGAPALRPLSAITPGARLLVSPGELVPVAARLVGEDAADFSLAWVTGESDPVAHVAGSAVIAGAHLLGREARVIECLEPFAASGLHDLLRRPPPAHDELAGEPDHKPGASRDTFWHRATTAYVLVVLFAALTACLVWLTRDPARALDVTTAVLVVTCPCAIGLATPLAYELATNRLRKRGLHVRRHGLLDRARALTTVVFDKTGTLTLGDLAVSDPDIISRLSENDRDALSHMVHRSNHPKSRALAVAVTAPAVSDTDSRIEERPGVGLVMNDGPREFALVAADEGRDLRFVERRLDISTNEYLDVRTIARFAFHETVRPDARAQVRELRRLGLEVHLASGDAADRVTALALDLGIDPAHAHARMRPEEKAALVTRLEATRGATLMIGDGVNDALAFDQATVAGTPAIDRPTLPARADFFLTTRGVGPIAELVEEARRVRALTRRNLAIAFAYNGIGLTAALFGVLSPLVCAVAMPLSSLFVLALTVGSQREPSTCPIPLELEATA